MGNETTAFFLVVIVKSALQVSVWLCRQQVPDVKIVMGGRCGLCGKIFRDEVVNKRENSGNTEAVPGKMNWNLPRNRYQNFQVENNLQDEV